MALMNETQASQYLCSSVAALRKWRLLGRGPAYRKIGRLVRYSEADLNAFMEANRVQPTAAEVAR